MSKSLVVISTPAPQGASAHESTQRFDPVPEGSNILFLLPPFYTPYTPPLGISVMKAYIEQFGYKVKCFDFNVVPHIWVAHHKYFEILQHSKGLSQQHGYTNLWYILQAHMMGHLNGLDSQGCARLLEKVLPVYDLTPEPEIINGLVPVVNALFRDIEQILREELDLASYAVVGTSTYSTSLAPSLLIHKRVKEINPEIMTIMGGGVFADDMASGSDNLETLLREYKFVDHIVMGEGEVLFRELLSGKLRHKRMLMRDDLPEPTLSMKEVKIPDYSDFHMPNYLHLCIEGARSCPFQCKFCSETVQWGNYRKKPSGVLADQMIHLVEKHGNKTFFMGDSLMNPYIEDLSKSLLERNADLLYDGYLRADKIATDRVKTKRWAKSGCVRTRLGIESASAKVLKEMQKETTPEGISKAIKTLASAGIRVTTLWIVGFPGETEEDFLDTLNFIREHHRYIYELDVHYYYYYPYGQVWSRLHKCIPLYPPDVVEHVKFQQWEIENCDPPRDVKFERLRRINDLATEVGIPNLHTLDARYRAEERWQLLQPLAAEFFEGTLVSRLPYVAPQDRLLKPVWGEPAASEGQSVLSYVVRVSKHIDPDVLRRAARALIEYNEMLQVSRRDGGLSPEPVAAEVGDEVVSVVEMDSVEARTDLAQTAMHISRGVRPRAGESVRIALASAPDSAVIILAAHRAVADGRSVVLFFEDLFRIYEQMANDKPVTLRQPEKSYGEYVESLYPFDAPAAGPSSESGRGPRSRRVVTVEQDIVRRYTPRLQQKGGLSFTEFVLGGLVHTLAAADPARPLELDVRADTRGVDTGLQFTAGPLHATCGVVVDCDGAESVLQAALRARAGLRESFARRRRGGDAAVLVNLECLTSEPWIGGDEWTALGFVPDCAPTGAAGVEITGFLDRGRVSFAVDFAEEDQAFAGRLFDELQSKIEGVFDQLIVEIETREKQPGRGPALRRPAGPRFTPRERRRLNTDDLVEYGSLNGSAKAFPLVARPRVPELDPIGWAASQREQIERLLQENGAILFRGFDMPTPEHFRKFAETLSDELIEFSERAAPRIEVASRVYTSTEYPAEYPIPLHHENAFAYKWPLKLFLYSQVPASSGGETPIADDQRFFEMLDPEVRERFRAKGVMYVRNYSAGVDLPWQEVFQTSDRAIVEEYCRAGGLQYEWIGSDQLRTVRVCPAILPHPRTGKDVWFNHAHLFHLSGLEANLRESFIREFSEQELPRNTYYGDGTPIEASVLDHIRETYRKAAVSFPWQSQDVMLVDNMAVTHGREPFVGERKTLVIMADWSTGKVIASAA